MDVVASCDIWSVRPAVGLFTQRAVFYSRVCLPGSGDLSCSLDGRYRYIAFTRVRASRICCSLAYTPVSSLGRRTVRASVDEAFTLTRRAIFTSRVCLPGVMTSRVRRMGGTEISRSLGCTLLVFAALWPTHLSVHSNGGPYERRSANLSRLPRGRSSLHEFVYPA